MSGKNSPERLALRQKANQLKQQAARAERRRRVILQIAIVAGAAIVITAIGVAVGLSRQSTGTDAAPSASASTIELAGVDAVPFAVSDTGTTVGDPDAPVAIEIYEDYSCPACQDYAAAVGDTLLELAAAGEASVTHHPIQIVSEYGTSAGSAAMCVAEGDPANWPETHAALFEAHDPSTDGWGGSELRTLLEGAGVTDTDTLACIDDGRYEGFIESNTDDALDAGVASTPTLMIDGERSELLSADGLRAAVADRAAARG